MMINQQTQGAVPRNWPAAGRWVMIFLLAALPFIASLACAPVHKSPDGQKASAMQYAELSKANEAVEAKATLAARDPLRPIYHVTPLSQLIGDPNGPVYYKGEYHLFYQHFPYWDDSSKPQLPMWGHVVSKDMVRWERLPIALAPGPDEYDRGGIASGGCVINGDEPTIIYTGCSSKDGQQRQCIATSQDRLRTWTKYAGNPVAGAPPAIEGLDNGFRDPFVWREGDQWRMLVGSGYVKSKGGTVLLYGSKDLRQWEYLGPLCEGMGLECFQWECPTFFPVGGRHALIVSPLFRHEPGLRRPVQYSVGTYENNRFQAGPWLPVDLGGAKSYYASTSFADKKGRRIVWGFIMAGQPQEAGWCLCMSLPRVVTPGEGSTVCFEPLPELKKLRKNARHRESFLLADKQEVVLEKALGLHAELEIEILMEKADKVELRLGRSADGCDFIPLSYDKTKQLLVFGDEKAPFALDEDQCLRLHLFADGSIFEAYFNKKVCFSRVLPVKPEATGLSVAALKGEARVLQCHLWQMGPSMK